MYDKIWQEIKSFFNICPQQHYYQKRSEKKRHVTGSKFKRNVKFIIFN